MVLCVQDKNGLRFFDCTDKDLNIVELVPESLTGRRALLLDGEQPRFVTVPEIPREPCQVRLQRTAKLDGDLELAVEETLAVDGHYAASLRHAFKNIPSPQRTATLEAQWNAEGTPVRLSSLELDHLDDEASPLVVRTKYKLKNRPHLVGNSLAVRLPSPWEQMYLNTQHLGQRYTPFAVRLPLGLDCTTVFQLPPGYQASGLQQLNSSKQTPFLNWTTEANQQQDKVRLHLHVDQPAGKYPAESYAQYENAQQQVMGTLEQTIVVQKPLAPVVAQP